MSDNVMNDGLERQEAALKKLLAIAGADGYTSGNPDQLILNSRLTVLLGYTSD